MVRSGAGASRNIEGLLLPDEFIIVRHQGCALEMCNPPYCWGSTGKQLISRCCLTARQPSSQGRAGYQVKPSVACLFICCLAAAATLTDGQNRIALWLSEDNEYPGTHGEIVSSTSSSSAPPSSCGQIGVRRVIQSWVTEETEGES